MAVIPFTCAISNRSLIEDRTAFTNPNLIGGSPVDFLHCLLYNRSNFTSDITITRHRTIVLNVNSGLKKTRTVNLTMEAFSSPGLIQEQTLNNAVTNQSIKYS